MTSPEAGRKLLAELDEVGHLISNLMTRRDDYSLDQLKDYVNSHGQIVIGTMALLSALMGEEEG